MNIYQVSFEERRRGSDGILKTTTVTFKGVWKDWDTAHHEACQVCGFTPEYMVQCRKITEASEDATEGWI